MAAADWFTNVHLLVRWLHVIAGITWLGMLYFFNFVNVPAQAALDDATKAVVNPQLLPRALWWFRWGAMVTFAMGLVLYTMNYLYVPGFGFGPNALFHSERNWWIMLGMTLGTVMWFNVWFIIWPAQRRLLSGVAGEAAPALRRRAALTSKVNTYLSGPMLFGMLGAAHYTQANALTLAVFSLVGLGAIGAAYGHAKFVGKTV